MVTNEQALRHAAPAAKVLAEPRLARVLTMLLFGLVLTNSLEMLARGSNRCEGAEVVAQWNFSRGDDRNFDLQPDDWQRTTSKDYPHYLKLEIVPYNPWLDEGMRKTDGWVLSGWRRIRNQLRFLPSLPPSISDITVDRYLRGELNGGAIKTTSPSFEVADQYSYLLSAKLKTEGLVHNRFWVELVYYDAMGAVVSAHPTPLQTGTKPWTEVRIGPIPASRRAVNARVIVHLEPGQESDFRGACGVDDIVVTRLPRIRLTSDVDNGLYSPDAQPEVRCLVSGLEDRAGGIKFVVQDETGQILQEQLVALEAVDAQEIERSGLGATIEEGFGGVAVWQMPRLSPGFYRVSASLTDDSSHQYSIDHTIAVLNTVPTPAGPFGWSLTSDEGKRLPLRTLPEWLSQCRVQWVKYPCWFPPEAQRETDEVARLMSRLEDRQIQTVGVICRPPEAVAKNLGTKTTDPIAVQLRDAASWQPLLEPVMTRLSNGVKWWQLGDEFDFSFLGRSQLKQTVEDIRTDLQGYGQPINIILNWPWVDDVPPLSEWSWHAVCLSDTVPPTAAEINAYLRDQSEQNTFVPPARGTNQESATRMVSEAVEFAGDGLAEGRKLTPKSETTNAIGAAKPGPRPWLIVDPLPADEYPRDDRIRDLILRMIAVRQQNLPAAFISNPFNPKLAILRPDGTPDEMLLPWRTAAALIGGMQPVGVLELPNGSPNFVLANDKEACLVLWSNVPQSEQFYFGPKAKQIDAYGREIPLETISERGLRLQKVQVLPVPTFITNIDRTVALWALSVTLDRQRIDSLLGRVQELKVEFNNPEGQSQSGAMLIQAPESWNVDRYPQPFNVDSLSVRTLPLSVALGNDATVGRNEVTIRFRLDGERPREFEVIRFVDVGPEDVRVVVATRLLPDGRLVVRQEITNESETVQQFDCYVYAPNRLRQRETTRVAPQATEIREFYWPAGKELLGKMMQLRAEQITGARTLNFRFPATP